MASCVSKKEVVYLQEIEESTSSTKNNYEPVIKADDILFINVSSIEPKASEPFNLVQGQNGGGGGGVGLQIYQSTYLVNNQGYIQFPVLGELKVGGLNRFELLEMLKSKISEYVKDPVINLRIINYKITVIGEVNRPGAFNITGERITIIEAIALAGDMTLFGKRENVMIVRESEGVKTIFRLDLTDPSIINSPYYYLTQNDLVYVEPNKRKINSTAIGPNILAGISILGFALTTILLLTR
jgi:polysaccharide export outer membrane protein